MIWERIKSSILTGTVALLWLVVGTVLWWAMGPIHPALTIDEMNTSAVETTTVPGGRVSRTLSFTANVGVPVRTYRRLVEMDCDQKCKHYELEPAVRTYEVGHSYNQTRALAIPDHVSPGRYRVEIEARWRANPLRDGFQKIPPFTITVTAPEPAK